MENDPCPPNFKKQRERVGLLKSSLEVATAKEEPPGGRSQMTQKSLEEKLPPEIEQDLTLGSTHCDPR